MNVYCWKLVDGKLEVVADPVEGDGSVEEGIAAAGYVKQLCSSVHEGIGGFITLYTNDQPGKPPYYIDVNGHNNGLASLVADDFPQLLQTFKELQPLLAMMAMEQQADMQIDTVLARDNKR